MARERQSRWKDPLRPVADESERRRYSREKDGLRYSQDTRPSVPVRIQLPEKKRVDRHRPWLYDEE